MPRNKPTLLNSLRTKLPSLKLNRPWPTPTVIDSPTELGGVVNSRYSLPVINFGVLNPPTLRKPFSALGFFASQPFAVQ
jgi:hypothetical protein